ncbi:MAG: alpha-D-ribose 1-methylphosphonate 5-triphosphate diphosphatase, partial [Pseudomonadota bacterium]
MWLSDMKLVLADRVIENGSLRIENGVIAEIVERPGTATHMVFPGFIDMHGDMIEHELEPRPGVDFPMEV